MALGTHPAGPKTPALIESIKPTIVRKAVEWAILAPSSHNTQPWRFKVLQHQVELWADRSKALPVVDPHDRELTMSCGAALYALRVGFAQQSGGVTVTLFPDGPDSDRLATLRLVGKVDSEAASFAPVMLVRHTHRKAFRPTPVAPDHLLRMQRAALSHGATLHALDSESLRQRLAVLIGQADVIQLRNPSFRRELALWIHANHQKVDDGIPGSAFGFGEFMSRAAPLVIRTFDLGNGQAAKDRDLASHSPLLAVLATPSDTPLDWLNAGQALMKLLLTGVQCGIQASYLNQPIEVAELRDEVSKLLPLGSTPQLVLRLGYADPGRLTPRRPVDDVIEWLA